MGWKENVKDSKLFIHVSSTPVSNIKSDGLSCSMIAIEWRWGHMVNGFDLTLNKWRTFR